MAGLGSLIDVKTKWTIDDLMDAHECLDIRDEADEHMVESCRNAK
jgi:hypothetical protein